VLYQLSYWPKLGGVTPPLLGLAMQRMLAAARTIFIELQPVRVVATIFLCGIVSLLTIVALQRNDGANTFLLRSHSLLPNFPKLFDDLSDDASADSQTTFTDGELRTLFQRHRDDQLHR
jgi:hypothetical protein